MKQNFQIFLNIFIKLAINIAFAEEFEQMSIYAKFMKQILSIKKRLEVSETGTLNEEWIAVLQKEITTKDEGSGEIHHFLLHWNQIFIQIPL